MGKAFGKANKKVGDRIVDRGRPAVRGLRSPGGSRAMSGIKSSAKQNKAVIALNQSSSAPTLFANVFGTLSHQVFGRTISGSGPWLPWVGTSWKPEQLHGIGPVIKDVADDFALDEHLDAVLDALKPAFPD